MEIRTHRLIRNSLYLDLETGAKLAVWSKEEVKLRDNFGYGDVDYYVTDVTWKIYETNGTEWFHEVTYEDGEILTKNWHQIC